MLLVKFFLNSFSINNMCFMGFWKGVSPAPESALVRIAAEEKGKLRNRAKVHKQLHPVALGAYGVHGQSERSGAKALLLN